MDYKIQQALLEAKQLKELLVAAGEMCKPVIEAEIDTCEKYVAKLQGDRCRKVIAEETRDLRVNGGFNPNAAWSLKKKLFPKCSEPPFAVFNKEKQLVTDYQGILDNEG